MAVLGESRHHTVEKDDVALGHGGEYGKDLIDLAALSELSDFLVGEEDSVYGSRHALLVAASLSAQRSHFYSCG